LGVETSGEPPSVAKRGGKQGATPIKLGQRRATRGKGFIIPTQKKVSFVGTRKNWKKEQNSKKGPHNPGERGGISPTNTSVCGRGKSSMTPR